MAPKQRSTAAQAAAAGAAAPAPSSAPSAASPAAPAASKPPSSSSSSSSSPPSSSSSSSKTTSSTSGSSGGGGATSGRRAGVPTWDRIVSNVAAHYRAATPQRTKLLDAFMAFLVAVGGLQFVYCVLAGNYPFNAFLSGFAATVGQFVLTASLRIQTTEGNKKDFPAVSPERAFADYVVCSLILHFFCVNFIN
ncbi:hypothetical protein VTK56DRAFT_4612 [Thermocarpiscus australiensis]